MQELDVSIKVAAMWIKERLISSMVCKSRNTIEDHNEDVIK